MSLPDVAAVLDHVRLAGDRGTWRDLSLEPGMLSAAGCAALERIEQALSGFDRETTPWGALAELLLDRTRIVARLAGESGHAALLQRVALWQLMSFVRDQRLRPGIPIESLFERIRQLMRTNEDRALRQLPRQSEHIDAVRIMTAHGAKGLEAPVVHIVGLNIGSFPGTPGAGRAPPPPGLIEDGDNRDQQNEQDCLFYVALSRARKRLFLYACDEDARGRRRSASPYLARLPLLETLQRKPFAETAEAPSPAAVQMSLAGDSALPSASDLAFYGRCPRRFLYTHILQIGRRRRSTPLMLLHEAVRRTIDGTIDSSSEASLDAQADHGLTERFAEYGLDELDGAGDYRTCANRFVRFYLGCRGVTSERPTPLQLDLGSGERMIVRADELVIDEHGRRTFRLVRTAHVEDKSAARRMTAAALALAVRQQDPDATIEVMHLADEDLRAVAFSETELDRERHALRAHLRGIRQGDFPPRPAPWNCPGCPALFVCDGLPPGALGKKIV